MSQAIPPKRGLPFQKLTPSAPVHPRRPPAHASVSLKASPLGPNRKPQNSAVSPQDPSSSEQSSLINNKHSSGESSNAERWFENSNNNVRGSSSAPFVDNDPPFYHRDSSNESPHDVIPKYSNHSGNALLYRVGYDNGFSPGSSSEEYRSVIDDLTIENKKLKQRLRKLQKSKDSALGSDMLFEVRVHGLAPAKKRELDEVLKHFALGLHQSPSNGSSPSMEQYAPRLVTQASKFGDSGYGSGVTSTQTPTANSGSSPSSHRAGQTTQTAKARNKNIRSYLHDIPEGLMPKHSTAMTETTKKKLVVRRLEQIFAGRGAAPEGHQLPMQQQEVSHSAAKADRSEMQAQGQRMAQEGVREAHIMDAETEESAAAPASLEASTSPHKKEVTQKRDGPGQDIAAVEQRPTRPLDLDPHRAQIPSENIEYFRHLGFQVPDASERSDKGGESWIYLNLLINMAQLHTVNVTPEFVKKALSDYSAKFELSADGRKVRWRGGQMLTNNSSHSGAEMSNDSSVDSRQEDDDDRKSRKRIKLSHQGSRATSIQNNPRSESDKLAYTPLFHRRNSNDYSDESLSDSASQLSSAMADELTGHSSAQRTSNSAVKRREDGPIVYYNNATFCTDLTGDSQRISRSPEPTSDYAPISTAAVGSAPRPKHLRRMYSNPKDNPLHHSKDLPDPEVIDSDAELSISGLSLASSHRRVQFIDENHFDFEVSGLGGIRPADNLAITVVRQYKAGAQPARSNTPSAPPPARLARVLEHKQRPAASSNKPIADVVSTKSRRLPPSTLPPPSYAMELDSDSDSDSSGAESESSMSMDAYNGSRPPLSTAPQPLALISAASSSSSSASAGDSDASAAFADDDDSGSVDLLASARCVDPAAVRAREREYDAALAERLAEDIPAGSSAATAGGGSGFTSPVDTFGAAAATKSAAKPVATAASVSAAVATTNAPADVSDGASATSGDVHMEVSETGIGEDDDSAASVSS